jgi:hypothetical protein
MGRAKKILTPKKVSTPGSYLLKQKKKAEKEHGNGKKQQKGKAKRKSKGKGRPTLTAKKGSSRKDNYMSRYTPEDLQRAYDLVKQVLAGFNI